MSVESAVVGQGRFVGGGAIVELASGPIAIDLFAGCGGLSLGLKWAGWDIATAVEKSDMAAATYFANITARGSPERGSYSDYLSESPEDQIRRGLMVNDVRELSSHINVIEEKLRGRPLTLLAGGPPCQGFSLAGRRRPDDPRNDLVWEFLKVVDSISPLAVLMENVDAIRSTYEVKGGPSVLENLEEALGNASAQNGGYSVARISLRADSYGVPQRRKRTFLIGLRNDIKAFLQIRSRNPEVPESISLEDLVTPPVLDNCPPSASEAIWDLIGSGYAPLQEAPSELGRQFVLEARSLVSPGSDHDAIDKDMPPNHEFRSHKDSTRTRFKLIRLFRDFGVPNHVFALAARGQTGIEFELRPLQDQLPIEFPLRTVHTIRQLADLVRYLPSLKHSQRSLDADSPAPTITTLPDDLCHYSADRTLTVREMARLQSFPDSFVFEGKVTTGGQKRQIEVPQYSQVGNAVPPLLAKALGLHLKNLLSPLVGSAPD